MKFTFPRLDSLSINNFSLYEKKGNINLDLINGVFCLAGANGLGKSTFLNLINYGLTGIVIDPSRDFSTVVSTSRFYNFNKKFALNYFDGRVNEIDREQSSIKLDFSIGEVQYSVERALFNNDELIEFSRIVNGKNTVEDNISGGELFSNYCDYLTKDIGLASFDQFVFIQHFVLSFDEHHYLLFWNNDLMETSLYLFFGVDPLDAKKANELRKDIKRFGSLIRNFVYHKNKLVKDTENLKANIALQSEIKLPEGIEDEYLRLQDENENLQNLITNNKNQLTQVNYLIADTSYKLSQSKAEYQNHFENLYSEESNTQDFLNDLKIVNYLNEFKKSVCNDRDTSKIVGEITQLIKENFCIKQQEHKTNDFEKLQEFDKAITKLQKTVEENQIKKERLENELNIANKNVIKNNSRLNELDKNFGEVLNHLKELANNDYSGVLKVYENQINEKTAEIEKLREDKYELEKEFKKLERILNKGYDKAEEEFIPLFNKYAHNFLGLDIDLKLRNSAKGSTLVLIIEDSERNDIYQLSESQRYFIDIALRMALIEHSCEQATLLIDTPEGSLDIAYESRAGQMFGDFSQLGYNIIMTANINTSQLLVELATKCTSSNMKLERMTEWTHLSEVQYQEEQKIMDAYKRIEEILN